METLLEYALAYAGKGYYVFPVRPKGKEPLIAGGHLAATTDVKKIQQWWTQWPDANIGLSVKPSNLLVLDLDRHPDKPDGVAAFRALQGENKLVGSPPISVTGGHGAHIFLRHPDNGKVKGQIGPGIDVKTNGYVLAPPSIHPNGKVYKWRENRSLLESTPPECPDWLLKVVLKDNISKDTAQRTAPFPPSSGESIIQQCAFLQHCVVDASSLSEQDWYYGLGVLVNTIEAPAIVHKYSSTYPDYSISETEAKLKHWKQAASGPPSCQTIQEKCGNEYCRACPYNGRIKGPITLGYNQKPLVIVNTMSLPEQVELILQALRTQQYENPSLFVYGGKLVEVIPNAFTAS